MKKLLLTFLLTLTAQCADAGSLKLNLSINWHAVELDKPEITLYNPLVRGEVAWCGKNFEAGVAHTSSLFETEKGYGLNEFFIRKTFTIM